MEHHATYRHDVEFLHIPGLLQTEEYARAVFAYRARSFRTANWSCASAPDGPQGHHRRAQPDPVHGGDPRVGAAHRVGDRAASRAQLTRVLELSEADHVTVRVIPFDLDGFAGATSGMTYVGGAVPKLDTALRDTPHGTAFIDAEAQLGALRTLFRKWRSCVTGPRAFARLHPQTGEGTVRQPMATPDNWQKSSFSGFGDSNDCVELAASPDDIRLRESDTPTTHLRTAPAPLAGLLHHIKRARSRTTS